MAFRGWPVEAIELYEGVQADNSRTYWQEHKDVYERCVRGPMEELLRELEPKFGEGKIFRPHRDVRFSADKSPYKTHIGATLAKGGYVQLSADGLAAGCGMYVMSPDQLARFREVVAGDERAGRRLVKLVDEARQQGIEVTAHQMLKTAPKGYDRDHPRVELLRHKGLVTWRQWEVGVWLGTAKAKERVVDFFRASAPIQRWLDRHVGG